MGIIRVQKNSNYSVISNVHLQDESLSWKAKGILSYLLSKPDDWQIYISHLKNQSTDGRDATASGIRELIDAGYITRDYSRNKAGQITGRDYVVHEIALENKATKTPTNRDDNPKTENPSTVDPTMDNPSLLNTDYIKDGLKENNDDVQAPRPPDPTPEVNSKVQPSSSLSEDQIIKTLARLFSLVPKQFLKPSVRQTIEKALIIHSEDYAESAIQYTNDHSNGHSWQKYRAYLDKTINHGYADGYQSDAQHVDQGPTIDFKKMPDENLRFMANTGNVQAIEELKRRGLSGSD